MAKRTYGQLCGLARALDLVGERWTLLIVRDLDLRPRRFTDLQTGLPGISTGLLSERLQQLEDLDVARRTPRPRPQGGIQYELTARGKQLAAALLPLARWGVPFIPEGSGDDAFEPEWLVLMLRSLFRAESASGLNECYEFRVDGASVWACVDDGRLEVGQGSAPRPPDFVLTTDIRTLAALGAGRVSPRESVADERARVDGDVDAALRALDVFSLRPTAPLDGEGR